LGKGSFHPFLFPGFDNSGADSEMTIRVFGLHELDHDSGSVLQDGIMELQNRTHPLVLPHLPHLCPLRHAPLGSRGILQNPLVRARLRAGFPSRLFYPLLINFNPVRYPFVRDLNGEFIATIILSGNTMSFVANYGIAPWINVMGQKNTFILMAVLALICNGTMFVAIWRGKRVRVRYWGYLEVAGRKGLSH
jgi:hypothetical protein